MKQTYDTKIKLIRNRLTMILGFDDKDATIEDVLRKVSEYVMQIRKVAGNEKNYYGFGSKSNTSSSHKRL